MTRRAPRSPHHDDFKRLMRAAKLQGFDRVELVTLDGTHLIAERKTSVNDSYAAEAKTKDFELE